MKAHSESEVYVYAVGEANCAACAPVGMPREEIEEKVNQAHPIEIGGARRWRVSSDKVFRTGEPMPAQCPQIGCKEHWLLEC